MRVFGVAILCILSLSLVNHVSAQDLEEVKFSNLFSIGTLGDEIIIQVPDGKVLVFDERPLPYALEGKSIIVRAKHALVKGKPILRSWSDGNVGAAIEGPLPKTPPTAPPGNQGEKGNPGAKGKSGAPSGIGVFDLGELKGDEPSILTIMMRGQTGGPGQQGGQGGRGGKGSRGAPASDDILCSRPCPDAGGPGAQGGQSGAGGIGGDGGMGGTVYVSKPIMDLLKSKSSLIVINVDGGEGGQQGLIGKPGIGGEGGDRGEGSMGCRCRDVPGPAGPDGPVGPETADSTPPSSPGPKGIIKDLY